MIRVFCILLLLLALPVGAAAQGEPMFAVHRQPAIPLVTLRMSLLVNDPPGLAGAGHLIQHLQYGRLQSRAQVIGGEVRIERTADAIVYSVTGPAAELRFLAELLRSTLQPPTAGAGARLTAARELEEERLAEWETAGRHLRAALRGRLFPMDISAAGTASSAARLADRPLDEIWARLYDPARIAILAVGEVDLEGVRREFVDLPPALEVDSPRALADTAALVPLAPAEATRGWFGVGYPADDLNGAAVSVTARLLGNELSSRLPGSESVGEHWWTHHGQALALIVAAEPRELATAARLLPALPSELLESVTDAAASSAAKAIRHDMLFYSRTPDRMAEVLGQFIDRGGDAGSAQRFYAELAAVDADDVREVLRYLIAAQAVRVEIPPQELIDSQ